MSIEAIAFDKDGVIFDSERPYGEALGIAIARTGVQLPENIAQQLVGLSATKSYAKLADLLGAQMPVEEFVHQHWLPARQRIIDEQGVQFIEGAESLIEMLYEQGYPLALVTSDNLERTLEDVNSTRPDLLKYFSVVITVDDVLNPKPDPECYQRAAALLGVPSEQLLVIEDSDYGATAAIEAGAQVLLLAPEREIPAALAQKIRRKITKLAQVPKELY